MSGSPAPSASRLAESAASARARVQAAMESRSLAALEEILGDLPPVRPLAERLSRSAGPLPRLIAAMKQASPGAGRLRESFAPRQIAMGFARAGASALSVATEPRVFLGNLDHLYQVRPAHLPVLRSDYLVTPYQLAESRVAGADAALLIAALLKGPALGLMLHAARRYGIEAVTEVHDEEELARALDEGARVLLVNRRDRETLALDSAAAERLASRIPPDRVRAAGGGIGTRADVDRLLEAGYEALLVGEALMRASDPGDALWRLMQPPG